MTRRSPIYYSDSQKALMWERWKAGDTLSILPEATKRMSSIHCATANLVAVTPGTMIRGGQGAAHGRGPGRR